MDLPFLKTITQAGGKLNNGLIKEISEYCLKNGKRFFVMYGQTEASPRISYVPHQYAIEKVGSIGVVIPGGKLEIVDNNGKIINSEELEGELRYEGKNVSMGYASKYEDLKKGDENNNILFTGDIAKRDKDGFYYIVGRKKRIVKIFGNRVNLDDIEMLLKINVTECACTGIDDLLHVYIKDKSKGR